MSFPGWGLAACAPGTVLEARGSMRGISIFIETLLPPLCGGHGSRQRTTIEHRADHPQHRHPHR